MSWQIIPLKGRVRCFRSLSATLDDLARAGFPAHMGRASSWPNALADRDLLSWLCLQTRFRQILEGARIVDRPVANSGASQTSTTTTSPLLILSRRSAG